MIIHIHNMKIFGATILTSENKKGLQCSPFLLFYLLNNFFIPPLIPRPALLARLRAPAATLPPALAAAPPAVCPKLLEILFAP